LIIDKAIKFIFYYYRLEENNMSYEKKLEVGTNVCFFEGKKDRPVAYTDIGKVILCKHRIPLGYAKIKSVEDKGNYFLVMADHIVKDIYSGIDYDDFIAVLPLHGFKIGFDRTFIHRYNSGNEIQEHQIYAYNLKNNVVIVAETFKWEDSNRVGFNAIDVYCPQVSVFNFNRCGYVELGSKNMTVFNLVRQNNGYDLLKWINNIMKDIKNPFWPEDDYPSLWTYEDTEITDENGNWNLGERHLAKLLDAPESFKIFKGCKFLEKIKCI